MMVKEKLIRKEKDTMLKELTDAVNEQVKELCIEENEEQEDI